MSGRKNAILPYHIIEDGDMGFPITPAKPTNVQFQDNIGFQVKWTGTASGTIAVEASLNYIPDEPNQSLPANAGDWFALTFDPELDQPSGTAGGYGINVNQCPYPWIRPTYVPETEAEAAELEIQDLTYTAVQAGTAGNDITVAYINPAEADSPLTVEVDGTDIVVNLETDDGTAASLVIQDLTYTADAKGVAGNSISITYVEAGTGTSLSVGVVGTAITVNLATDGGGASTSTAALVAAAITASAPAAALVNVTVSGTGSNVQIAAVLDNLENGTDYNLVSTADEVAAAIEASEDASALVTVEVTGTGSDVQTAAAEDNLAGGTQEDGTLQVWVTSKMV